MYTNIFFVIEFLIFSCSILNLFDYDPNADVSIVYILILYLAGVVASLVAKGPVIQTLIYTFRHYIVLAVYSKILILANHPELVLGALIKFNTGIFRSEISGTIATFTIFSISIFLVLIFLSALTKVNKQNYQIGNFDFIVGNRFNFFVLILILVKLFLSESFDLAKPGVLPVEIPIPMLTGLLNNYCIHVVLAICTFLLLSKNTSPIVVYLIVSLNLGIDFLNGYKFSIITTFIISLIYNIRGQSIDIVNLVSRNKFFTLLGILCVAAYPVIDLYSDLKASLGNVDVDLLIEMATTEFSDVALYLPFAEIVRRVNGIDTYMMMSYFVSNSPVSISTIFDSSMIQIINDGMYGKNASNVVSAAGSTIFLPLHLSLGEFFGSMIIFILIAIVSSIILFSYYFFISTNYTRRIYLAFMCVEFLRYIFSAGDFVNNLKLTVMYILTFIFIDKYVRIKVEIK